jgi:hypothetical protein
VVEKRKGIRTTQRPSGRKKMLTNVRSLTFSPSCVAARDSITALALKSWGLLVMLPSWGGS